MLSAQPAPDGSPGRADDGSAPLVAAHAALELVPAPIVVLDFEGVVRYANAACCRLLGMTATDLVDCNAIDLLHPDDAGWGLEGLAQMMTNNDGADLSGEPVSRFVVADVALRMLGAGGRSVPVSISGSILPGDGGEPAFVFHLNDSAGEARLSRIIQAGIDSAPEEDLLRIAFERFLVEPRKIEGVLVRSAADDDPWVIDSSSAVLGSAGARFPFTEWGLPVGRPRAIPLEDLPTRVAVELERVGVQALFGGGIDDVDNERSLHVLAAAFHDQDVKLSALVRVGRTLDLVKVVTQQIASSRALEYAATHDQLTGLANRVGLDTAAEQLAEAQAVVLFLDTDGFKAINDSYGHGVGDALIKLVAGRISSAVREGDVVARLGGDEFVVLAALSPGERADVLIAELSQRLEDRLSEPYELRGQRIEIGASVGTSILQVGEDFEDVLNRADRAMYRAKRSRRAGVAFEAGPSVSPEGTGHSEQQPARPRD